MKRALTLSLIVALTILSIACFGNSLNKESNVYVKYKNLYFPNPAIAIDCGDEYLIAAGNGIIAYNPKTDKQQVLISGGVWDICYANDQIYYLNALTIRSDIYWPIEPLNERGYYREKLDGSQPREFITRDNIALAKDGSAYFSDVVADKQRIVKMSGSTGKIEIITEIDKDVSIDHFYISNDNVYWAENSKINDKSVYSLRTMNEKGGEIKTLCTYLASLSFRSIPFRIYDNKIYYVSDSALYRMDLDGKNITLIYNKHPVGLFDLNQNGIFFSKGLKDTFYSLGLYKIDYRGKQDTIQLTQENVYRMQVVGKYIFYNTTNASRVGDLYRINIDGTDPVRISYAP